MRSLTVSGNSFDGTITPKQKIADCLGAIILHFI